MDVALVVLAIVVAVVAFDALARAGQRRPSELPAKSGATTTGKIVVDLAGREDPRRDGE